METAAPSARALGIGGSDRHVWVRGQLATAFGGRHLLESVPAAEGQHLARRRSESVGHPSGRCEAREAPFQFFFVVRAPRRSPSLALLKK